jgi:ribosomal protein S18 acetylase RimI-like enzyme
MDDFRVRFTGKAPLKAFTSDEREAILFRGNIPVGNCNWQIPETGRLHINWFEIDGPYRHRGYGRALWLILEKKLQRYYKVEEITLFYQEGHHNRARFFWGAMGFEHDKSGEDGDAIKLLPKINSKSNTKPLPRK